MNCWVILTAFNGTLRSNPNKYSFNGSPEIRVPFYPRFNKAPYTADFNPHELVTVQIYVFKDTGEIEKIADGQYARIFELVLPEAK